MFQLLTFVVAEEEGNLFTSTVAHPSLRLKVDSLHRKVTGTSHPVLSHKACISHTLSLLQLSHLEARSDSYFPSLITTGGWKARMSALCSDIKVCALKSVACSTFLIEYIIMFY